jgi:hypothetical protein
MRVKEPVAGGGPQPRKKLSRPAPINRSPSAALKTRIETDSMEPIEVPADRYWGAQTERSRINFRIGEERMPHPLIVALAIVKRAAAETNLELGLLRWARNFPATRRRSNPGSPAFGSQ